jgi:hypothetical protein
MNALFNIKKIFLIQAYVRTPPKNPIDPTNIITRRMAIKMSPKITMAGRRTAKTAFPVEIPWPSLTPIMVRMNT